MPIIPRGYQTSELYVTAITMIIGMLVTFHIVAPDSADQLINALTTIAGAIMTAAPAVSYILGRSWLKARAVNPPPTPTPLPPPASTQPVPLVPSTSTPPANLSALMTRAPSGGLLSSYQGSMTQRKIVAIPPRWLI